MNRRNFISDIAVGLSAMIFAPKLISPKWKANTTWFAEWTLNKYGFWVRAKTTPVNAVFIGCTFPQEFLVVDAEALKYHHPRNTTLTLLKRSYLVNSKDHVQTCLDNMCQESMLDQQITMPS